MYEIQNIVDRLIQLNQKSKESYSVDSEQNILYMLYFKIVSFVLFSCSIYIITRNKRPMCITPLITKIFFRVCVRMYYDFFFSVVPRLMTK